MSDEAKRRARRGGFIQLYYHVYIRVCFDIDLRRCIYIYWCLFNFVGGQRPLHLWWRQTVLHRRIRGGGLPSVCVNFGGRNYVVTILYWCLFSSILQVGSVPYVSDGDKRCSREAVNTPSYINMYFLTFVLIYVWWYTYVCWCLFPFLCRWEVSPTCLTKLNGAREAVGSSSYIIMYLLVFLLIDLRIYMYMYWCLFVFVGGQRPIRLRRSQAACVRGGARDWQIPGGC